MQGLSDHVEVVAYDPAWPERFAAERRALVNVLAERVGTIEHVGSTAVPGLAAKPTIDLMVGVETLDVGPAVVEPLKGLGYNYLGEFGLPWRHFFRKGLPPTHHVHWVRRGADFWTKQIVFRDYLRAHPAVCAQYERLKRGLVAKFADNRAAYTAAKTDFILDLQEHAWRWAGADLIVYDLEATCWEGGQSPERQETIEIGAVRLDAELKVCGEFSRLVKPKDERQLSDFCTRLTAIRQEDIDKAEPFSRVLADFAAWAGTGLFRTASWSDYDLGQLRRDCARGGALMPAALERHLDLQAVYARRNGQQPRPMIEAMGEKGLSFEGRQHGGIADARNAARLAQLMLGQAAKH